VPVEKDQVRPDHAVRVLVDPEQPLDRRPGSALRDRIELANLEGRPGFFPCTGWCMLLSSSLFRGWLPNSAPFLDFSHLRS
jgi:hypothetical protein